MKKFLRAFIFHGGVLLFVSTQIGGIQFADPVKTLAFAAIALTLVEILMKPVINLMLLPLNLITLGTFRWVANVLTLYLATVLVSGFKIVEFTYRGFQSGALIIPEMHFGAMTAFLVVSFVMSFLTSFLFWLCGGGGGH
jgi:putative membrane protein